MAKQPESQQKHMGPQKGKLVLAATAAFSGPLPPLSLLEQYNKVIPNAVERIIRMAEQEGEHRH